MINTRIFLHIFLISLLAVPLANANSIDRAYLHNLAVQSLTDSLPEVPHAKREVHVAEIDPRIVIKPCSSRISVNIPENHNGRNVNLRIRCEDEIGWQLYLPAKISTLVPVLVATSRLSKGSLLHEGNIEVTYREESKVKADSLQTNELVIGAKTKRYVAKGGAITRRNICLVCKGEEVEIIARGDKFSIKASGVAMSDGSIGEQIRVKNSRSGKTVKARVDKINTVVINI